jgi:hypothetical protein
LVAALRWAARERGIPLAVIAKWLGHADASITARIYAHSQDDALREASTTLGQVVTPKTSSMADGVTRHDTSSTVL